MLANDRLQTSISVESLEKQFINDHFKYYNLCDWTPGMKFMVMPERKDIIIPPFKSAETNKEVDTGELKHKIFEYLGSEITERGFVHFNFECEGIWSVRYSEFLSSPTSNPNATPPLPEELLTEMQDALEYYRSNLQKKESELQYFQALANHIDMAILVYTPDGQIEWINDATKRLIHINRPHTVNDLIDFHPELPAKLRTLKAGDLSVWQIKQEEETVQFALSSMEFIIQGRKLLIAGMKNIHSALDNRETEAWQKLIRVLTHEIMNSITPIISLTELLTKYADNLEGDLQMRRPSFTT